MFMERSALRIVLLLLLLTAQGCASQRCPSGMSPLVIDTLYFGTIRTDGGAVTVDEWKQFLDRQITPKFPSGLTWWRSEGQWRNASGVIDREASFVLRIAHPSDAKSDADLKELIESYKRMFSQEAVMRTRSEDCAGF